MLIYYLTLSKIFQSSNYHNKAWSKILSDNSKFVYNSYNNKKMVNLMIEQIKYFSKIVKGNGIPIIVIFPYLKDLKFISKKNKFFYSKIITETSKYVTIIDLTKKLLKKKNKDKYFVSLFYGSHLSKKGNKFFAEQIYNFLKKKRLLKNNF